MHEPHHGSNSTIHGSNLLTGPTLSALASSFIMRWQTKIRKVIYKNIKCLETYRFRIESGRYFVYQKRRDETRRLQGLKRQFFL